MSGDDWWLAAVRRNLEKRKPCVERTYFAAVGDVVKIGYSKDPAVRLRSLRYGGGCLTPEGYDLTQLALLGSIPGGRGVEDRVHMLLTKHLCVGEWFYRTEQVQQVIDYLLDGTPIPDAHFQALLWAYLPEYDPELARAG